MSKLSRILVPVGFPPDSAPRAIEHATAIAARTNAELHFLHVQVFNRDTYGWSSVPDVQDIEKIIGELSRRDLDKLVTTVPRPVVTEVIRDISEAPAILHYAKVRDIDLIVIGTHQRKGVSRMFLGSVSAEVLRHSPVPVLAVGPEHALRAEGYRRILAPIDFSDSSVAALRQASELARQHDAQLTIMHVVEPPKALPYLIEVESTDVLRKRAIKVLDEWLAKLDLAQAPQEKAVIIGSADEQIVSVAREQDSDLIVMGSVGLSGLSRLLLGSTTERVLRNAPCAVLAHRGAVLDNL